MNRFVVVYLGAVGAVLVASLLLPDTGGATADVRFKDPAKATLDYLTEMGKLAGTLNAALFAACGALAIKSRDWSSHWRDSDGYMIVLALLAGATSYYGTYLSQIAIVEMAFQGVIDPFSRRLAIALNIQYYALLSGVFLVGLVFTRMLAARKPTG
jgi:hypothetical protein